jgi:hypothetical protein
MAQGCTFSSKEQIFKQLEHKSFLSMFIINIIIPLKFPHISNKKCTAYINAYVLLLYMDSDTSELEMVE